MKEFETVRSVLEIAKDEKEPTLPYDEFLAALDALDTIETRLAAHEEGMRRLLREAAEVAPRERPWTEAEDAAAIAEAAGDYSPQQFSREVRRPRKAPKNEG